MLIAEMEVSQMCWKLCMDHEIYKKVADVSNDMWILTAEAAVCVRNFSSFQPIYAVNEVSHKLDMLAAIANVFEWSFEGGYHNCTLLPGGWRRRKIRRRSFVMSRSILTSGSVFLLLIFFSASIPFLSLCLSECSPPSLLHPFLLSSNSLLWSPLLPALSPPFAIPPSYICPALPLPPRPLSFLHFCFLSFFPPSQILPFVIIHLFNSLFLS